MWTPLLIGANRHRLDKGSRLRRVSPRGASRSSAGAGAPRWLTSAVIPWRSRISRTVSRGKAAGRARGLGGMSVLPTPVIPQRFTITGRVRTSGMRYQTRIASTSSSTTPSIPTKTNFSSATAESSRTLRARIASRSTANGILLPPDRTDVLGRARGLPSRRAPPQPCTDRCRAPICAWQTATCRPAVPLADVRGRVQDCVYAF